MEAAGALEAVPEEEAGACHGDKRDKMSDKVNEQ